MKRIFTVVVAIVMVLVLSFCGCAQRTEEAAGTAEAVSITLQVKAAAAELDKTFTYTTELSTLGELLEEKAEELELVYENAQYGMYIQGVCGVTADETCEYFAVYVNGESSMVGVSEIELAEGDLYLLELTGF